jgi:hypothetical protein
MTDAAPGSAREAAERNAQAVMSGNISQVMADITPEALTQMMQLAAANGGVSPATMPNMESYEIEDAGQTEDGGQRYRVTFVAAEGRATLTATWRQVLNGWKITAVALESAQRAEDGDR